MSEEPTPEPTPTPEPEPTPSPDPEPLEGPSMPVEETASDG